MLFELYSLKYVFIKNINTLSAQSCPTLSTPWTVVSQAPLSMEFSSKSTGEGCCFIYGI